tara:strand:+ start:420 stop:1160 length:741 start_codon:yes stop_codon:yes gene_type:complete
MKYKSLFVSDLHLGLKQCKIEQFLLFFDKNKFDNIFLVGDIFDFWQLKREWYWEENYNLFIENILKASRQGSNVYYAYGNHDDIFNCFSSRVFIELSNINIQKEFIYEACGHKILITHGDKHDYLNKCTKYLRRLAYTSKSWIIKKLISLLNEAAHEIEKKLVKWESKKRRFKTGLQKQSKLKDCKAVICGHIHTPDIHRMTDSGNPKFLYMNCGDYLDKETCIVEDYEGNFSLLDKGEVFKSVQM